jgi:pseudouridine kinase
MANQVDISPSDSPVLVIGASGMDIVGRLESDLQTGTSNPATIRFSYGGVARNVAENLARLGQPVRLITAVGDGPYGDRLVGQLAAAGVDVNAVLRTSDYSTGAYLGVINTAGELQLALDDMHAISALTPVAIREQRALFKEAALIFLDANLPEAALRTVMSIARQVGLKVFADPTSLTLAPRLSPYLEQLYFITPNCAEAAFYCQRSFDSGDRDEAIRAAKYLVAQGVDLVLITMAELGVCYATSQTSGHIPALRTEIVDPTGAGDALTSALIFGLLNEIPLDDAVRLGVSAASLTLRYPGAVLPDLSLEKLYAALVI